MQESILKSYEDGVTVKRMKREPEQSPNQNDSKTTSPALKIVEKNIKPQKRQKPQLKLRGRGQVSFINVLFCLLLLTSIALTLFTARLQNSLMTRIDSNNSATETKLESFKNSIDTLSQSVENLSTKSTINSPTEIVQEK